MGTGPIRRQPVRICLTLAPRAFCCTVAGLALDAATVIVCTLNVVSIQQAIAIALPAALTTAAGMIGLLVPDPWAAWRRGFQHGCAAARCETCQEDVDVTTQSVRPLLAKRLARAHAPGRHRALRDRRSNSGGPAGYVPGGGRRESVSVHVLDSEQREYLRDRCAGRVGDPLDRGHGCGLARQPLGSEEGVNHLVAVTALPHPDEHPAGEALTCCGRSVRGRDGVLPGWRGDQERIRFPAQQD